jgi:Rrf2 family protein
MLSKKTKYALNALLVLAESYNQNLMQISEVAQKASVPKKFLEQILLELKNNRILDSKKGQGGGYFLRMPPETVTLGLVIRIMSGTLALVPCVSKTAYAPCDECKNELTCGLKVVMEDVRESTASILDSKSLADVLKESAKRQKQHESMYHI